MSALYLAHIVEARLFVSIIEGLLEYVTRKNKRSAQQFLGRSSEYPCGVSHEVLSDQYNMMSWSWMHTACLCWEEPSETDRLGIWFLGINTVRIAARTISLAPY